MRCCYCHTVLITVTDINEAGQRRLGSATVLVVGVGGLGSPLLSYLAAAGIGQLCIVDDDTVDTSNLHRQVIHAVRTSTFMMMKGCIMPRARLLTAADRLAAYKR